MVNINLVPEKIRTGETLKILFVVGAISLVFPVLFWAGRYQQKNGDLAAKQAELAAVQAQLDSPHLKEVVAEVEQFAKDQADLDAKRSIVDELRKRQVIIPRFLDLLPDLFPGDGRVDNLVISDQKGVKHCVMTCDFLSLEGVATVYENLDSSNLVAKLSMSSGPKSAVVSSRNIIQVDYNFDLQVLQ